MSPVGAPLARHSVSPKGYCAAGFARVWTPTGKVRATLRCLEVGLFVIWLALNAGAHEALEHTAARLDAAMVDAPHDELLRVERARPGRRDS